VNAAKLPELLKSQPHGAIALTRLAQRAQFIFLGVEPDK
jgi:hypothetical protein